MNTITVNGNEISYDRIDNDVNGNPCYVVHFLSLGIKPADYGNVPGLTKYRAKRYGGGHVFQSYNLEDTLRYALRKVEAFYGK